MGTKIPHSLTLSWTKSSGETASADNFELTNWDQLQDALNNGGRISNITMDGKGTIGVAVKVTLTG